MLNVNMFNIINSKFEMLGICFFEFIFDFKSF